ncbi:dihydroneopterin triphosphate diphosphatase [Vogesella amnigena]|uniref:Dihydroneopterin triphosphate diphosphatase n=1 Tax=Vogesella amnigena TaxID=1507449 RepID=A0ABV7TT27_9NEIS
MKAPKQPVSVLVVIHTPDLQILLIERADRPGYWQSVTGSREGDEALSDTARREVLEETGIDAVGLHDWQQQNVYEIYPHWRHRYAPGVTHNTEHVFSLQLPAPQPVQLAAGEHLAWQWLPWQQAAELVFSPSNADAIKKLAKARLMT